MVKIHSIPDDDSQVTLIGAGDLKLSASRYGLEDKLPVLLAHGLGQNRHTWDSTAEALAYAGYYSLTYDARGHGESDWNPPTVEYTDTQFTDDLIITAGEMPQAPVLVAASMGGLFGILAEARWPGLFRAMVLVDITPRWEISGVQRILGFMSAHPGGFASLQDAADVIYAYLPHRQRKSESSLRNVLKPGVDGRWHWHWDPRLITELAEVDVLKQQARVSEAAKTLRCPTLLISGGRSELTTTQNISEFLTLVPHAEHLHLPDASHMLAGDDNAAFTAAITHFLGALPSSLSISPSNTFVQATGANS